MNRLHAWRNHWQGLPGFVKSLLSLASVGLLVLAYVAWAYTRMPGAMLYVHNHTDRPISGYAVNEVWGGNAFAYGGGKVTCCSRIEGDVLTVAQLAGEVGVQLIVVVVVVVVVKEEVQLSSEGKGAVGR
mgnify:CR=1 FL=1